LTWFAPVFLVRFDIALDSKAKFLCGEEIYITDL
jgi:hypothetical protein